MTYLIKNKNNNFLRLYIGQTLLKVLSKQLVDSCSWLMQCCIRTGHASANISKTLIMVCFIIQTYALATFNSYAECGYAFQKPCLYQGLNHIWFQTTWSPRYKHINRVFKFSECGVLFHG